MIPRPTVPATRWREPSAGIPLRWGAYRPRYVAAVSLLLAGGLLLQAGSAYSEQFIVLGFGAHVAGWLILPGRGARRASVALPSALLVGSLLLGGVTSILLAIPLAFWLYLRQRPPLSYIAMLLPILSGVILSALFPEYGHGGIIVSVSLVVIVATAWIARSIARTRPIRS
ncbi:MAG: hypothetical protein JWM49_1492 [Microbacteriaceae bacterium]|jgi:hypothetical protein|nr:hypothetical protein [Microbacteriaceae bacterium]